MLDAGAPPEKILGQLGWLVRSKFPAHRAGARLPARSTRVFRTDLDLKRSAGDPRVLLERLVVELCAGKRARAGADDGNGRESDPRSTRPCVQAVTRRLVSRDL